MHVLEVEDASGSRSKVVLRRRLADGGHPDTADDARFEFSILEVLQAEKVPAPSPILLDAEGRYFGAPALVLSYLPGRPLYATKNVGAWVEGLASALAKVHAITPDRVAMPQREPFLRDAIHLEISDRRDNLTEAEPLAQGIHLALEAVLDHIAWVPPTLTHDDYWPGNTVWHRGRLVGIIDWADAVVGDRRTDVAQCRVDLILSHGVEVADGFLDSYLALAGPLPDMRFFDLFRGLRGLLSYERWLAGYHDLGLTHLTAEVAGQRLRSFLTGILGDS
ncbi:MAG TPA: aminoglycoside phosphotransferase family protein [Chloroflexota bacterium]